MEGLFRTAVSGFKKDDVLTYIDKQDREFRQKEGTLKHEIESLKAQLASVSGEALAAKTEKEEKEKAFEEERQLHEEAEKQKTLALDEVGRLREELSQENGRIEDLKRDVARLSSLESDAKEEVREREDRISELERSMEEMRAAVAGMSRTEDRISRVLMEAQNTADNIIAQATAKAEDIVYEARKKLNRLLSRSLELKEQAELVRAALAGAAAAADEKLSEIAGDADGACEKLQTSFQEEAKNLGGEPGPGSSISFDFSQSKL